MSLDPPPQPLSSKRPLPNDAPLTGAPSTSVAVSHATCNPTTSLHSDGPPGCNPPAYEPPRLNFRELTLKKLRPTEPKIETKNEPTYQLTTSDPSPMTTSTTGSQVPYPKVIILNTLNEWDQWSTLLFDGMVTHVNWVHYRPKFFFCPYPSRFSCPSGLSLWEHIHCADVYDDDDCA